MPNPCTTFKTATTRFALLLAFAAVAPSASASYATVGFSNVVMSWDNFTPSLVSGAVATSTGNSLTFVDGVAGAKVEGTTGANARIHFTGTFSYTVSLDATGVDAPTSAAFIRAGTLFGDGRFGGTGDLQEFFAPRVFGSSETDNFFESRSYNFDFFAEAPLADHYFRAQTWAEVTGRGLSAAPIPEPSSYALMLAGLASLGVAMRRRRRQA